MRYVKLVLPVVFGLALLAGCAKPPLQDIQAAKAMVDQATAEGASDYASAQLTDAQNAATALDAELQAQEKKFALFRSYKQTMTLAADLKTKGETAVTAAKAGKEQAKNEAQTLINEAKASREEANSALATAPAGKGSKADIDALKADVQGVDTSLGAADAAFNEGRFLEAKAKAQAAKAAADTVKAQVQRAMEMKKAARKKA